MQDALVAVYPSLPDEPSGKNPYIRTELNYFI
jgi:hypothetical protein